jgi:hypothetical protein
MNALECCKKMKIFDFGKGNRFEGNRFRREIVLEKSRSATLLTRVQNNDRVQPADDGSSAQQVMQESLCTSPCAAAGKACTATWYKHSDNTKEGKHRPSTTPVQSLAIVETNLCTQRKPPIQSTTTTTNLTHLRKHVLTWRVEILNVNSV